MNKIARNLVVMVVFATAMSGLALALAPNHRLIANIPFDFYAGSTELPAGTYTIVVDNDDRSVMLRSQSTGRSYELLARPGNGDGLNHTVLDFHVIGGMYLLADLKDASNGLDFPQRKVTVAAAQRKSTVVVVAAVQ